MSSTSDGPVLVYWPWGEHYNSQFMSASMCIGCVSSQMKRSLQYKHVFQNVLVPTVQSPPR
jgi:hypothetical protein